MITPTAQRAAIARGLTGLDRCREILFWGPIGKLDPTRRMFQTQALHVMLLISVKALLDGVLARKAAPERTGDESSKRLARKKERTAADA